MALSKGVKGDRAISGWKSLSIGDAMEGKAKEAGENMQTKV